jgi:putative MATE family efflux protein
MTEDRNLNDGAVWRALFATSAPMSLGILGVLSVGLADAFFLARSGEAALAAISFIFPVTTALTSLSIGLSAGTNTVVSQAIGQGASDRERQRMALHAMALAALLSAGVSVLFYLTSFYIFSAMGASGEVLEAAQSYAPYWCLGFPFMVTGMSLNAVFRAAGRAGVAASVMVGQSILNIALNPVFIFGWAMIPALGAEGAGIATGLARMVGFAGVFGFAVYAGVVRFDCAPWRNFLFSFRRIGRVGAPAAIANAINPAGMAIVTAAVAVIGDAAVAGFGAAGRVQSLLIVPMLALSSGIGPVVGQAWGAGDQDRARKALRLSFVWSICIGLGVAAIATVFADPIARTMTGGESGLDHAVTFLRVASWGVFAYGMVVVANAALNARDKALHAMSVSLLRIFVLTVPLVWLGLWIGGYVGILIAMVAGNVLGAVAAVIVCKAVGLGMVDWPVVRRLSHWLKRRGIAAAN